MTGFCLTTLNLTLNFGKMHIYGLINACVVNGTSKCFRRGKTGYEKDVAKSAAAFEAIYMKVMIIYDNYCMIPIATK